MKKIISITVTIIFSATIISAQTKPKQTDLEIFGLNGKVKSVVGTTWFIDEGTQKNKTVIESQFNESGYFTSQTKTAASGYKSYLKCDGKGSAIEFTDVNTNKTIYTQDAKGNTILEDNFAPENGGKVKYKYDDNNNLIEKEHYDNDDVLIAHTTYKYDANGNQIEEAYFYGEVEVASERYTSDFDAKGNKTEEDEYDDGALTTLTYYEYNSDGNKVSSKQVGASGNLIFSDSLAWDSHHNLIYMKSQDGELFDAAITITLYEYEYDSHGNWIKKTAFIVDGKTKTATDGASMEIVYY